MPPTFREAVIHDRNHAIGVGFNGPDDVIRSYGADAFPESIVRDAYDVFRERYGPFVVGIAADMLPAMRDLAARGHVITFLGRDGHILASAVRGLDPEFFGDACREIVFSRVMGEEMLADLAENHGRSFPEYERFRRTAATLNPDTVPGAYERARDYVRAQGVPVGLPDSKVTVVDVCFSGTVQETLAAAFTETEFRGLYAFHAASSRDPHPGTKRGYAVDLPSGVLPDDRPLKEIPHDPALMFACNWGFPIWEFTLEGPMTSAERVAAGRPVQNLQSTDPHVLDNINPVLVDDRLDNRAALDAVKTVAHVAIHDYAREINEMRTAGADWRHEISEGSGEFMRDAFDWFRFGRTRDEKMQKLLDTLVLRDDAPLIQQVRAELAEKNISGEQSRQLWEQLAAARTLDAKKALVAAAQKTWTAQSSRPGELNRTSKPLDPQGHAVPNESPAKNARPGLAPVASHGAPPESPTPTVNRGDSTVPLTSQREHRGRHVDKGLQKSARLSL
ncbi:hypothetical protein LO772_26895 [Yinghuangia sp. ASG 101]|uniref:hypothetical protein n=1 Tax=Yinghuangia sp. ASG 101 TaxID=2896848 RepID=UPI001E2E2971|nr:hypothetical protein [Yinghuangia sp. ASG 101]UGQ10448.1 hypothetical protein LO772_26895 [Yinghuangia sp. ASG 101]